jgi:hypothetical protein
LQAVHKNAKKSHKRSRAHMMLPYEDSPLPSQVSGWVVKWMV